MTQPRLGNAVIINSVCDSLPGSRLDAASLESAYETVGFDVFVCNDFNSKVKCYALLFTSLPSTLTLNLVINQVHGHLNQYSLLEIIANSERRHALEFNSNQETTLVQGAKPLIDLN